MSRGFGATFGVGSTDIIASGFTTAISALHSFSIWANINSAGGGNLGRMFAAGIGVNGTPDFFVNTTAALNYSAPFNVTRGQWSVTAPAISSWHHYAVVYDGSNSLNTPLIYVDGVSQVVGTTTAPVGIFNSTATAINIGNSSDSSRGWNGKLAEFSLWNGVLLTAAEIVALSKGMPALFVRPKQLSFYLPLFGTQANEPDWGPSHVTQTITGTKIQTHAPVTLWQPPTPILVPEQVPTPSFTGPPFHPRVLLPKLRLRARI